MERARHRNIIGYTERHHVIPKCLGGPNTKDNIVRLTAREHYVAHLCLWKSSIGIARRKMACAVRAFRRQNETQLREYGPNIRFTGRVFESIKHEYIAALSKEMRGAKNPNFGGRFTNDPEVRARMRVPKGDTTNMGKHVRTPETLAKLRANRAGKGMGARNAMSDPANRAKVGASKVGRRIHVNAAGERKYCFPGQAPEGFAQCQ